MGDIDNPDPAPAPKVPDESIETIRKLLRPIKYSLVDLFISLARVFFFWLPGGDIGKGQALMVAHFVGGCVLYTLYFVLPSNQPFRLFIFLFFVIVILQQLIFRGCVITKAEQKLTSSEDTILDPWIRLCGFEPTRELRIICSIGVVGSMAMTLLMNTILDQFRIFN
jgi:hypothetical protein